MSQDVYDELINNDIINNVDRKFSIEVKNDLVYNQKNSFLCWAFAGINMLRNELSNMFPKEELNFSVNYISFFDRYEKMILLYDRIISEDFEYSQIKYLLFDYINTCGDFSSFKYLIKKYGIVLEHQMPIVENNYIPNDINELFKEKIINDIEILFNNKNDLNKLKKLKENMINENYEILCSIFGKPPLNFDSKILNINEKYTPVEFSNKYINDILDNYINVISLSNKDYKKRYILDFNVPNFNKTQYLNLDIDTIKKCVVEQLKDSKMVWFGCSYRFMSASLKNKNGILFNNLYNFEKIGISKISKSISEKYDFLNYDHAMLFTGVNIVDEKIKSWKVLNSFGTENNYNGYFTMDNDFFDENVFMFAIHKKYLPNDLI